MNNQKSYCQPEQTLIEHLRELRSCLVVSFAAICVGFLVCYGFIDQIAGWFLAPLAQALPTGNSVIFTSYQEGFFFI